MNSSSVEAFVMGIVNVLIFSNFDQDEMSTKLHALQNNIGKLQGLLAGKYKIDQPTLEVCCILEVCCDVGGLFI